MKIWLEKALIKGAFYRQSPAFAFGKALVSPRHSETGADIYFQMRQVAPDDVVLHLRDNLAIVGRSFVQAAYNETRVGNEVWYRVPLRDYTELDPPLNRAWFFDERYRGDLLNVIASGHRRLFYTRQFTLMQGRYLSEVPPSLFAI